MPVYEYECKECNKIFEVQQKMADKPLTNCPECNEPVKKLVSMSSFQLKGGGWYETDFKEKNRRNIAGGDAETETTPPMPPEAASLASIWISEMRSTTSAISASLRPSAIIASASRATTASRSSRTGATW